MRIGPHQKGGDGWSAEACRLSEVGGDGPAIRLLGDEANLARCALAELHVGNVLNTSEVGAASAVDKLEDASARLQRRSDVFSDAVILNVVDSELAGNVNETNGDVHACNYNHWCNRPGHALRSAPGRIRLYAEEPTERRLFVATTSGPSFAELGVAEEICDALDARGIHRTFAIQELTLPLALDGTDIIGQARTGMGKTFGFGVPLLDRVFDDSRVPEPDGTPRALVVVPTRELAGQVREDLEPIATALGLRTAVIYGGRPYDEQIETLQKGVDVIVGTPGRIIDLHQRGDLDLSQVAIMVLDEADEMLDLGFLPDIEKILLAVPDDRQTMLFSATMPGPILTLARTFMNRPIHIRAEAGDSEAEVHETTRQVVFQSHQMDKIPVLARILQAKDRGRTIIFTRTKRSTAAVAEQLGEKGFLVTAVHGDMGQPARERSLAAFREGTVDVLVATDVAARGIDIDDVTHVINHQVPEDEMTYVHRIGRTGRAGHSGTAVTLVGWDELPKWQMVNSALNLGFPEPPQWFSTSPEFLEALDIPEDAPETVGQARPVFGARPPRSRGPRGEGSSPATRKSRPPRKR